MRRMLQRKLQSQRGASLLLALLLLLICSMVGASILMAAASNAGKHRSNLKEHQTYLALSSAVSLLCDELNAAQYTGQYRYWVVEHIDPKTGETSYSYHFSQEDGIYSSDLRSILRDNFDAIFAAEIEQKLQGSEILFSTKSQTVSWNHSLTLQPQTGTALDGREVSITLNVVKESYAMELTATLDDYTIEAELTPASSKPTLPASLVDQGSETKQSTAPMTWKIGWITTGGEEEEP